MQDFTAENVDDDQGQNVTYVFPTLDELLAWLNLSSTQTLRDRAAVLQREANIRPGVAAAVMQVCYDAQSRAAGSDLDTQSHV